MRIHHYIIMGLLIIAGMTACRKQDEYKKYLEGGEILYTGKADSMRVHAGRKRVQVSWLLISDPKITVSKLYWNNRNDSAVIPINRTRGIDTIRYIVNNLEERTYEFEIFNYDKNGNVSVKSRAYGVSYGSLYEDALLNRAMTGAEMKGSTAIIKWADIDSTGGIYGMQIRYTGMDDLEHDTIVRRIPEKQITEIPRYKFARPFSYRTVYMPDTLAIDLFFAPYEKVEIGGEDITYLLKNAGPDFKRSDAGGGRFGVVADWEHNGEALRHGTSDNINGRTCLTFWIWDDITFTNAKLSQTIQLPAGEFRLEADVQNIDYTLQATYLTMANGNSLPNVENIGSAIGSSRFLDNSGKHHVVNFVLATPATVTLGLVSTMVTPTAQTLRIDKIRLYQDK